MCVCVCVCVCVCDEGKEEKREDLSEMRSSNRSTAEWVKVLEELCSPYSIDSDILPEPGQEERDIHRRSGVRGGDGSRCGEKSTVEMVLGS